MDHGSVFKTKSLIVICLLALVLRIPFLNGSLWMDEAAQAMESSRPLSEQTNIGEDYQPPLFHIIVHFFLSVSHQEWWIRMPSFLAGIGTVALLYLIVDEKLGRRSALAASLLLATSPFHIFYSQELRPYSFATFFAILSWYILISSRWKRRWVWYTIVTTLGLYSMYLIPFNILAQLVYVFTQRRKDMKAVLYCLCAVALLFLPWLPSFLNQLRIGTALTSQLPGWAQAVATPQLKVLPLTLAKFIVGQVTFHGNPLFVALTAVVLCSSALFITRARNEKWFSLFFIWFFLPLVSAWLVSFVVPVIQPKRVLFILPALYALLGYSAKKNLFFTLVCAFQILCLFMYWNTPAWQRENWRDLIQNIERSAPERSAALFAFPAPFAPWQWYSTGKVSSISTGRLLVENTEQTTSVSSQLRSVSTIYLFSYLRDLTDPSDVLHTRLDQDGFTQQGTIDGKAIGFVRIFVRMN